MSKCKMPKCGKKLVGNEKYICKSCKDVIIGKSKDAGKGILGVGAFILMIFGKGIFTKDSESED